MTYEKNPFDFKGIPDFAFQPAKEADDEYNYRYTPRGATNRFDPAAYERVLYENARRQAAEAEEKERTELLDKQEDKAQQEAAFIPVQNEIKENINETDMADFASGTMPQYPKISDDDTRAESLSEPEEAAPVYIAKPEEAEPVEAAPVGMTEPIEAAPVDMAKPEEVAAAGTAKPEEVAPVDIAESEQAVSVNLPEIKEEAVSVNLPEIEEETIQASSSEPEAEVIVVDLSKPEEEDIPISAAPPQKKRSVFQPVFVPKSTPPKNVPVIGNTISSKLKLVDMKNKTPLRITIEEDILVPDIKPDMAQILAMDGNIKLSEKDIHTGQLETDTLRISGDLTLQTLYIPERASDGEPIVAIESKIPFKNEASFKASPYSDLGIKAKIESIDYTIINERKFRARATALISIKEYNNVDIEVFEGLRNEEVQMLKENIKFTDVAFRKMDSIEVKEELVLKENMPEIYKILKYDANIVENHKQITKEKAVINASVYFNILYLGAEENTDVAKAENSGAAFKDEILVPVLYQGKTEFTQFIRMDGEDDSNDQNPAGSKVNFDIVTLNLTAKEDGNGKKSLIEMDMNVDTELEIYKTFEKQVVTDIYHHIKDIQYETDEIGVMVQGGNGVAELSAREIINIPERYGNVDKIVYLSGNINEKRSFIDQAKNIVEGIVDVNLICTSDDTNKTAFNIRQEIPFRSAMEIPGITSEMTANNEIVLKDLWFDKINSKQVEVNAGILVNTTVASQKKHQLVKNISFLESPQDNINLPGIVLYVSRDGDTIWKIAKKYRTTIDDILNINELEYGKEIKPGTKLLIVAKHN
ncbi:MAG: SPOCS domain-containing protein [Anaerovoracaceae bacterium]